jgi:hypothetical protein
LGSSSGSGAAGRGGWVPAWFSVLTVPISAIISGKDGRAGHLRFEGVGLVTHYN